MMSKRVAAEASEEPAISGATARRLDRRLAWIAASAAVLAVSTFVAVRQPPRSDPYDVPGPFSLGWFLSPVETHPEQRLLAVAGEIRALWSSAEGERIWAVGEGGLAVRSFDGGGHWERVSGLLADAETEPFDPPRSRSQVSQIDESPELRPLEGVGEELGDVSAIASVRQPTLSTWGYARPFVPVQVAPMTDFTAVHFLPDGLHGWIGAEYGLLLRTTSGGESWQVREAPWIEEGLSLLSFSTPQDGCALLGADPGRSATTSDGGVTWDIAEEDGSGKASEVPRCGSPADAGAEAPEMVASFRRPFESMAEGWLAPLAAPPTLAPFATLGAWAAAEGGLLAVSSDAGATWRLTTRNARFGIRALHFLGERLGFAGGRRAKTGGYLDATEDGGRTWMPLLEGLDGAVVDVGFLADGGGSGGFGWAATDAGELFVTTDRGNSWIPRRSPDPLRFRSVEFASARHSMAVDANGGLWATIDGGERWKSYTTGRVRQVVELVVVPDGTIEFYSVNDIWLAEDSAELDEVERFRSTRGTSRPLLGPLLFPGHLQKHDARLWLGGPGGLARSTLPTAGEARSLAWEPLADDSAVSAFFFLDEERGWRAEPGGGLAATTNGGRNWIDLTRHSIYPAPWYWLAVLLGVMLLVPALARPPVEEIQRSVAEMAVSDRPIGPGDPDPLGFERVARGLSRFLRNTATRPPLTVAIVGEWGTGKSSLMNLVQADLDRYGFRPVWFNAWHHQKEEHLLAALLENIRRQAVPSWFRPEGWIFRGRLLGERLRRWFGPALVGVVVFGVATGWVIAEGETGLDGLRAALDLPVAWAERLLPGSSVGEVSAAAKGAQPIFVGWLLSAVGVAFTLVRGLRAFGIKPAKLAAGLSEHARVRDIEAQTGFRYRFAREFADVTRALSPRTLTVMIDDLDRCRPQNVLDVLEAVNFLVSSGECFVLLGIDRDRVERCVGYGFRDVAEEILDRDAAPGGAAAEGDAGDNAETPVEAGRRRRAAFARQYLEKLINIEVPVPRGNEEAGQQLLHPAPPPVVRASRGERFVTWARRQSGRWWLLPVMLPMALASGLWFGSWGPGREADPVPAAPTVAAVASRAEAEAAGGGSKTSETAGEVSVDAAAREVSGGRVAGFAPALAAERSQLGLWGLVALCVVGVGFWVLTTLPEVEVHDSPEFLDALVRWYPLLHSASPTPRSTKRFLNRVRFYAMGQRAPEPSRSRLDHLLARLSRGLSLVGARADEDGATERPPLGFGAIPEQVLVALAAVQHTHPEWLAESRFWTSPQEFLSRVKLSRPVPVSSWQRYRQDFERLSRGIERH